MRKPSIVLALLFFSLVPGVVTAGTKISQLPDGRLSNGAYANDALDLRLEVADGWIADADPKQSVTLDSHNPDGPINRCSKLLLSSHPQRPAASGFKSTAVLFAVDPKCFSDIRFPRSQKDKRKVQAFAAKIVKAFLYTGFIAPSGADVDAFAVGDRVMVVLTGDGVVGGTKPIHINTKMSLTQSNGFWVVSAALVDDEGKAALQATKISFRVKD